MIVVVESPCKPSPGAVKIFTAEQMTVGEFWPPKGDNWHTAGLDAARARGESFKEGAARAIIRLRNTYYARAAMLDCLERDEAPFLSHLLYAQVLDDDVPAERKRGMEAGDELSHRLLLDEDVSHVFYDELGVSGGMVDAAAKLGHPTQWEQYMNSRRRQLGAKARAWYEARVPASIAWLK